MAEADFDEFETYDAHREGARRAMVRGGRFQSWVNGAGALTSVALMAGLGVWAYNLAVRDVHGVPVIQALEGPARIAPKDPGGDLALHQGMAVNKVAADGLAEGPPEQLTLAPKPDGLGDGDLPMAELSGSAEDEPSPAEATAAGQGEVIPDPIFASLRPAEPLPDGPAEPIAEPLAAEPFVAEDVIPSSVPGVSRSPRPLRRPTVLAATDPIAEAAAAAVAAAMAPPPVLDVDAGALETGTRLVQIGSYPDEAEARLQWDKTAARFGALMEGKRRVIETAESGGQTFFRLRVEGFSDLDDARRFCAALKAENAECVPAVVR